MEPPPVEIDPTPPGPEILITIGRDGRLYCHDLTPELLPVLQELCGADPQLAARAAAAESLEQERP